MLGGKKAHKHSVAKIETLIGQNTQVEGNVVFEGGLHIDGLVKGNVICAPDSPGVLTLSEHGRIEGEVRVPNIILNGEVVGNVYAFDRVELASKAKVVGNVYYKLIEMAIGAEVNGNLVHTKDFDEAEAEFVEPSFDKDSDADTYSETNQYSDADKDSDAIETDDDDPKYAQGG